MSHWKQKTLQSIMISMRLQNMLYTLLQFLIGLSVACHSLLDPKVTKTYIMDACWTQMLDVVSVHGCKHEPVGQLCDILDELDYQHFVCKKGPSCMKLYGKVRHKIQLILLKVMKQFIKPTGTI